MEIADVLSEEEATVFVAMMQAGGHGTIAGVLRSALWNYAQHLEVDCPPHVFKLTGRKR